MQKYFLIALLIVLSTNNSFSQSTYIQIISEAGISVFLDSVFKGKTISDIGGLIIENVTPGIHTIRVTKEGYRPQQELININLDEVFAVTVKPFIPVIKRPNIEINISEKLTKYIDQVEQQTGRKILMETREDLGLSGMSAAFSNHPTHIKILFTKSSLNDSSRFEHSCAHEITHGLLIYGRKYFSPQTAKNITKEEKNLIGLICTAIGDIVVNKLIQHEGFEPISSVYIGMVKKETEAYKNGEDIYKEFIEIKLKSKFKIFRYIMAWGFLQYFDLLGEQRNQLNEFIQIFEITYPPEYEESRKICDCILRNNIFTSEGYEITFRYVLELWGLNDKIVN